MITERLKAVLLRELNLADFDFRENTLASEVPGWDSLQHVSVMAAVEKEYKIRFKSLEMIRLKNVGDLQALVDKKLA
jgi:acyl carrier protein